MLKEAFKRSFTGTLRHAKRVLQTNQPLKQGLVGAVLGGAYVGVANKATRKLVEKHGTPGMKKKIKDEDKKHPFLRHPLTQAAIGAAIGGSYGAQMGTIDKSFREAKKTVRGFRRKGWRPGGGEAPPPRRSSSSVSPPAWAKGVKTKAEAKKAFRAEAFKHHPDRGGSEDKMKKVNQEWDAFQQSHHFSKLSGVLPSFFEELELIHASPL